MSRFLGLASGETELALRATPDVQRIEIHRDGEKIATMTEPPWKARVDLGKELGPYALSAIGFGADGTEVARDSQTVNLARPVAEAGIVLERSEGILSARVLSTHVLGAQPASIVVKLDGKVLKRSATLAPVPLGKITDKSIHVVSVEIDYADGSAAKKEIVFGGIFSETTPVELTAIPVRQLREGRKTDPPCLQVNDSLLAPVAVERAEAVVSFVVNGHAGISLNRGDEQRFVVPGIKFRVISPVMRDAGGVETFPGLLVAGELGTRALLAGLRPQVGIHRFAAAVATTAFTALRGDHRRAVVYVLGDREIRDDSTVSPAAVRRYLQRVGVPLHVWSVTGPRPDLAESWGPVRDISSALLLQGATVQLTRELSTQRIAWLPVAPLDAYRAQATADCAYVPLSVP